MRKLLLILTAFSCLVSLPASADSVYFLGGFVSPSGGSDVFEQNEFETDFEVNDLNGFGVTFGYDHFLGDFVNIGGSVSYYNSDTTVRDVDFEFPNGQPILRDLTLQIVPLEVSVKFLPLGREQAIIPYIGGGIGVYFWEYEEIGDFVINRFTDPRVISGTAFSDGTDPGFHVMGGVQVPFSRSATITGEVRYWNAEGDLDEEGFDPAFEPIDLSGTQISGGVSFWF